MTALWTAVVWLILVCAALLIRIRRLEGRCDNLAVDVARLTMAQNRMTGDGK